jgi:uncharacterized protein (TIGR00288 family)
MPQSADAKIMAVFCDFENVALGVRDSNYDQFNITRVLERLLLKGNIVVKKAYCDWARYQEFKSAMHEASFELIEIPHVRQSGKNSADIRMVVDALDLCYTKEHVDTFVIISGDSDFSPLVSKLRENNKTVIGVGVRDSTSERLSKNCNEFIYYDDLVRTENERRAARQPSAPVSPPPSAPSTRTQADEVTTSVTPDQERIAAIELVVRTVEDLLKVNGGIGGVQPGPLKNAVIRQRPGFDESRYGYSMFSRLLEDAQKRGLLKLTQDEKSGQYLAMPVANDR